MVVLIGNDNYSPRIFGACMTAKNTTTTATPTAVSPDPATTDAAEKSLLSEHKGKLAIGVAATLGIMIFYNWWQKNLPKEDPEGYARLQRFKNSVKTHAAPEKHGNSGKHRKGAPTDGTGDPDDK
jgi:hypothetical protein